ncbi:MAG TPA: hypothetical protein VD866_25770 [Urbifossiella sp.]|nr:hypothetical protein [Urbifossiella sp.]
MNRVCPVTGSRNGNTWWMFDMPFRSVGANCDPPSRRFPGNSESKNGCQNTSVPSFVISPMFWTWSVEFVVNGLLGSREALRKSVP